MSASVLPSWFEQRLRAELVALGERLEQKGLIRGAEGNFSVTVDEETFLVSPRGRRKGSLQAWELVRAPLRGALPPEASSEGLLHQQILAGHSSFRLVVHAHPPWVLKLLSRGRVPNPKLLRETEAMRLALLPDLVPGSEALAEAARKTAATANVLLLPRHGVVVIGRDMGEAVGLLEATELVSFLDCAG